MEYHSSFNLLLEALAYFGRRAAGNTMKDLLDRLRQKGVTALDALEQALEPLSAMMAALDRQIVLPEDRLTALFGNLSGFPHNTIGSYSPVFLLYYPLAARL